MEDPSPDPSRDGEHIRLAVVQEILFFFFFLGVRCCRPGFSKFTKGTKLPAQLVTAEARPHVILEISPEINHRTNKHAACRTCLPVGRRQTPKSIEPARGAAGGRRRHLNASGNFNAAGKSNTCTITPFFPYICT